MCSNEIFLKHALERIITELIIAETDTSMIYKRKSISYSLIYLVYVYHSLIYIHLIYPSFICIYLIYTSS